LVVKRDGRSPGDQRPEPFRHLGESLLGLALVRLDGIDVQLPLGGLAGIASQNQANGSGLHPLRGGHLDVRDRGQGDAAGADRLLDRLRGETREGEHYLVALDRDGAVDALGPHRATPLRSAPSSAAGVRFDTVRR